MTRGRNRSVSDLSLLLEIVLQRDRPLFSSDLGDATELSSERARQIMQELADDGLVEIKSVSGRNLYYITDEGFELLSEELRAALRSQDSLTQSK
jgi:predicted transcriptional regulator